jgi:hypothetical protein
MAADGPIRTRIRTAHPFSFKLGMRRPKLLLRHAHSHGTVCRVAIGEDKAMTEKGWLR